MDTLKDVAWDAIIVGTGLQQSLLALALSRSGKHILHIDQNDYYGGNEAAFSLQELETWANHVNEKGSPVFGFCSTHKPEIDAATKLSSSRAYTLTLSPHIIYARSPLLPALVRSKVYRQLEFVAVGSWWIHDPIAAQTSTFRKVPNGREDVFSNASIDLKSKRALMKFLKIVADYENQRESWESYAALPFTEYLESKLKVPPSLVPSLLALTLSLSPAEVKTQAAIEQIALHLRSIGTFGPGFAAVVPKWGGSSEIAQVACRAGAVGGFTYILAKGMGSYSKLDTGGVEVELDSGEKLKSQWLIAPHEELESAEVEHHTADRQSTARSICVVSSPLDALFPAMGEGAPIPAVAVVVFPEHSLQPGSKTAYFTVHSSDTGECPNRQCVLYGCIEAAGDESFEILKTAVRKLIEFADSSSEVLFSAQYMQSTPSSQGATIAPGIIGLTGLSRSLMLDETALDQCENQWRAIIGTHEDEDFLSFEDRQPVEDDED